MKSWLSWPARLALLCLLNLSPLAATAASTTTAIAAPALDLAIKLDPATRQFEARALLTDTRDLPGFRLGRDFELIEARVNGQPARLSPRTSLLRRPASADFYPLPRGAQRLELRYRATLAPTPTLDHRQVLSQRAATAGAEGSFLPASAGWYPQAAAQSSAHRSGLFRYSVTLDLPAGQKGLVAGTLQMENDTPAGYHARFDFPHPADGIDLMAGPYTVSERLLKLDDRTLRLRTWLHPELAAMPDFASGYLDATAGYLQRYSSLIGPYPFASFSIVSSPTPTGFGMPTLTYLGRDVLKLPFIRATSLGHEILHNWWGNGVYPDWDSGNWSEGLTTFMADYAYKEDESPAAARDMRLAWLRDYAAVPAKDDMALKDFTARHHGIASIIGYNKSAMVFLMLRDKIGDAAFARGLRLFWQRHQFQTASWGDLEAAFSAASGQSQTAFFRQWVEQTGAPDVTAPDPDYRRWRRLDLAELPPILREVFVAPQVAVALLDADLDEAANALLPRLLDDRQPQRVAAPQGQPLLLIGRPANVDRWLKEHHLPARPASLPARGSAQVWAGRDAKNTPYVVIAAQDAAALTALARPLPHYGKQGWLVFDGSRAVEKGLAAAR